jgi:hypothetical protein
MVINDSLENPFLPFAKIRSFSQAEGEEQRGNQWRARWQLLLLPKNTKQLTSHFQ